MSATSYRIVRLDNDKAKFKLIGVGNEEHGLPVLEGSGAVRKFDSQYDARIFARGNFAVPVTDESGFYCDNCRWTGKSDETDGTCPECGEDV